MFKNKAKLPTKWQINQSYARPAAEKSLTLAQPALVAQREMYNRVKEAARDLQPYIVRKKSI